MQVFIYCTSIKDASMKVFDNQFSHYPISKSENLSDRYDIDTRV